MIHSLAFYIKSAWISSVRHVNGFASFHISLSIIMEQTHAGFANKVGHGVAKGLSFAFGKWKHLLFTYTFTTIVGIALLYMHTGMSPTVNK